MDAKKQSNSFTAELFGSKESASSSSSSSPSGLFNSIFPRPSKSNGEDHISSELTEKNHDPAMKRDSMDEEDKSQNRKTGLSPFYQQERSQPCHLSSSIYYGGQDIYPNPNITKNNPEHSTYNKEGEDDGLASRGNWWQGSLYY